MKHTVLSMIAAGLMVGSVPPIKAMGMVMAYFAANGALAESRSTRDSDFIKRLAIAQLPPLKSKSRVDHNGRFNKIVATTYPVQLNGKTENRLSVTFEIWQDYTFNGRTIPSKLESRIETSVPLPNVRDGEELSQYRERLKNRAGLLLRKYSNLLLGPKP